MHARTFLHKLLGSAIHKSRFKLLLTMIETLINVKSMTLTGLARGVMRPIQERSAIRMVDRFLGNHFFQKENSIIFKAIIHFTIGNKAKPEIIIDWSKVPNEEEYILRAALVATGRAITLYEEVHPKKKVGNALIQKKFLKQLRSLLPPNCIKPIIITDAGFKTPWFKEVQKLEWDFVGRVRELNKIMYSKDGKTIEKCIKLTKSATATAKSLGKIALGKANQFNVWCYVIKKKIKGRKKRFKNGKVDRRKSSAQYSRGEREGWVIVSSIAATSSLIAKRVINIYSRRMTIEEGFRDLKSHQYGFGMDQNKTLKRERIIVWLLLAALASLLAWIVGYCAEKKGLQHQFQANSIKYRRVLSLFYLGCQVIRKRIKMPVHFANIIFFEEAQV